MYKHVTEFDIIVVNGTPKLVPFEKLNPIMENVVLMCTKVEVMFVSQDRVGGVCGVLIILVIIKWNHLNRRDWKPWGTNR